MAGQHLQLFLLQLAECLSRLGVIGIVIGSSDKGGCSVCFNLALTRMFARCFFFFLRPTQGVSTLFSSFGVGLRIFLV